MSALESLNTLKTQSPFAAAAKEKAMALGIPTKKNENWKYTNLEKYLPPFDLQARGDQAVLPEGIDFDPSFDHLVFVNGKFAGANPGGGSITAELLAYEKDPAALEEFKKKMDGLLESEFTFQLSELQEKNQYLLKIDKALPRPLWIRRYYTGKEAKHSGCHLHVYAAKNAGAHILETHHTLDDKEVFANNSASFWLEPNANVCFSKAQDFNDDSSIVENIRAQASRDAVFQSVTIDAGARLSRNNISVKLNEPGAAANVHGLCALNGERQSDTNSFIRHMKGHTESAQLYKGIMADKSRGIFSGVIRMDKHAQLCNSEQLNKNLLLSKGAHAHSRPQLEIFADDVKAAHGSTTGQISEEELFYFQARGVSKERAQRLLAEAFLNDVLLKIGHVDIRSRVQRLLSESFKLPMGAR